MHDLEVRNLRATRSMISANTHCVPICRKFPFGVLRQRTPTYVSITRRPWQSCTLRQPTDGTRSQLSPYTNLITASKFRTHRAELTEARQMAVPMSRRLLLPRKQMLLPATIVNYLGGIRAHSKRCVRVGPSTVLCRNFRARSLDL